MYQSKNDTLELIRTFLPKYLSPEQQENLFKSVKENFPFSTDPDLIYFKITDSKYYYQGDGILDIPYAIFKNSSFKLSYLPGVIMSNTCDISPDNDRNDTPNIQFAAIFTLQEYIIVLKRKNISSDKIESFIEALKANKISNLFYLPEIKNGNKITMEESFVRFDVNVTFPITALESDVYNKEYIPKGDRLFSFSNYGFYLFLIKLSIHYCRFREGVFRNK